MALVDPGHVSGLEDPAVPVVQHQRRRRELADLAFDLAALGVSDPYGVAGLEPGVELVDALDGFQRGGERSAVVRIRACSEGFRLGRDGGPWGVSSPPGTARDCISAIRTDTREAA